MSDPIEELTAKFLRACNEAGESEQRVIECLIPTPAHQPRHQSGVRGVPDRRATPRRPHRDLRRVVDVHPDLPRLLLAWVVLNTVVLARVGRPFDAYPYIFLNLILSMLAALQAPVIMMSQNRHAAKDRVAAGHDYEVNLKAELEILALHRKIDMLREEQWIELLAMQREQIQLLTRLLEGREPPPSLERSPDATA